MGGILKCCASGRHLCSHKGVCLCNCHDFFPSTAARCALNGHFGNHLGRVLQKGHRKSVFFAVWFQVLNASY